MTDQTTNIDPSAQTFVREKFPTSDRFFATARDRMRFQHVSAAAQGSQAFARFRVSIPDRRELVSATLQYRLEDAAVQTITARSVDPASGAYKNMTWNSIPASIAGSADRIAVVGGAGNRQIDHDVTADVSEALAAGRAMAAFRFYSNTATKQWIMTNTVRLTLVTRPKSLDPVDVAPSGNVGTAKPTFTWTAPAGVTKVQVQVDDATDFSTAVYDSGELVSTVPRVDTGTQGPAWAGLSGTMHARVRHFTVAGWSAWEQVTLTYDAPTVFSVTNPGTTDADPSPPAVWTPSAEAFEIVTFLDGTRIGTTGLVAGPATSHTPKQRARKAGQVLKRVHRFYDGVARVQPPYATVTTETTFTPTATVGSLDSISVTQVGETPAVSVGYTRAAGVPDEVGLWYGDDLHEVVDGPSSPFTLWTVEPNKDITLGASAVVNGDHSATLRTTTVRTAVTGVWLVDPVTERGCVLAGVDGIDIGYGGVVVVHTPIDGAVLLRRTLTRRGPEGSIAGRLGDWPGRTREQQLDDIEWLADRPERVVRLILGDLNIPVVHSSLQAIFDRELSFTNRMEHVVSFDCSHAGDA